MDVERQQIELVGMNGESYLVPRPPKLLKYYVLSYLVQKDPPRNKFKTFRLDADKGLYYEIPNP